MTHTPDQLVHIVGLASARRSGEGEVEGHECGEDEAPVFDVVVSTLPENSARSPMVVQILRLSYDCDGKGLLRVEKRPLSRRRRRRPPPSRHRRRRRRSRNRSRDHQRRGVLFCLYPEATAVAVADVVAPIVPPLSTVASSLWSLKLRMATTPPVAVLLRREGRRRTPYVPEIALVTLVVAALASVAAVSMSPCTDWRRS